MPEEIHTHLQVAPTKRCPYCFSTLKIDAPFCIQCKKKIGPVNKLGIARKPFKYKAYAAAILWVVVLGIYIWKVFIERAT